MKYKEGDFGYWWTISKGNDDIEGEVYVGDIDCIENGLTSLRGSPEETTGYLDIRDNELTNLEYAPKKVLELYISGNQLSSLKNIPYSKGTIQCSWNPLSKPDSLVGLQNEVEGLILSYCDLISTKGISKKISGELNLSDNQLEEFGQGDVEKADFIDIASNQFKSAASIPPCDGIDAGDNPNRYLEDEYKFRKENPNLSEVEIQNEMFKKTKDRIYLSKETNSLFM